MDFTYIRLTVNLLITAVILSSTWQIYRHESEEAFWHAFWSRSSLGYGDPYYFLASTSLWLSGLFYFRCLLSIRISQAIWVKSVIWSWASTSIVFFLFQYRTHIPEAWNFVYFLPFEDISSFGSIVVSLFVFTAACVQRDVWSKTVLVALGSIGMSAMVVASWSRAAWLAAAVFLLVVVFVRLPWKWTALLLTAIASVVAIFNLNTGGGSSRQNPYLARLVALTRWESPASKIPERFDLYYKAIRMIKERPALGHGIGSFYLSSRDYAQVGDIRARTPDFAHNVWLQIAAEEGIPVAALFGSLCIYVFWRGLCAWRRTRRVPRTLRDQQASAVQYRPAELCLTILALTLGLGGYLQTQLTANSLNVYVSNQFFFWFLMAAILALSNVSARDQELT